MKEQRKEKSLEAWVEGGDLDGGMIDEVEELTFS